MTKKKRRQVSYVKTSKDLILDRAKLSPSLHWHRVGAGLECKVAHEQRSPTVRTLRGKSGQWVGAIFGRGKAQG